MISSGFTISHEIAPFIVIFLQLMTNFWNEKIKKIPFPFYLYLYSDVTLIFGRSTYVLIQAIKNANFWHSMSIFYVKKYPNLSQFFFIEEYHLRYMFFVIIILLYYSNIFMKKCYLPLILLFYSRNGWFCEFLSKRYLRQILILGTNE